MKGLQSLLRMARHRWWVIVLLAVVGAGTAYAATTFRNAQIDPSFEATAPVPFVTDSTDERGRAAEQTGLVEAAAKARELTARYTDEGIGIVTTDDRNDLILFTGRGRTEARAEEVATAMRRAYLDGLDAEAAQLRQQRLEEIVTEAAEILTQIETLDPPEPVEEVVDVDPEIIVRLEELRQLSNALAQQRTKAEVDLILATTGDDRVGTPEEIQEELDAVNAKLAEVHAEIADITAEYDIDPGRVSGQQPLQPAESTSADQSGQARTTVPDEGILSSAELADQWTVEALQERYATLSDEYSSFFTDVEGGQEEELEAVEVTDTAPQELPPNLYALLGGLVGMLLGMGGLFAQKRIRGLIYAPSDVAPIPVLTELPPILTTTHKPDSRQQKKAVHRRLEGVRRLRSTLLTFIEESEHAPAIGLAGVNIAGDQVRLLALDIAARVAASDRSVIILDLDFDLGYEYRDFVEDVSVAGLLAQIREAPAEGAKAIERSLADVRPGHGVHRVIRSGRIDDDATDLVLTEGFRAILESARLHADLILIVLPESSDTLTRTVSRRFDGMIAVGASGVSRRGALANVIPDSAVGGAQAVGVALLTGKGANAGAVRRAMDDGDRPAWRRTRDRTPVFATEGAGSDAVLSSATGPAQDSDGTAEPRAGSSRRTKTSAPKAAKRRPAAPPAPPAPATTPHIASTSAGEAPDPFASSDLEQPGGVLQKAPEVGRLDEHLIPARRAPGQQESAGGGAARNVTPAGTQADETTPNTGRVAAAEIAVQAPVALPTLGELPEVTERPNGRVKKTLKRVETALENVIALPGETIVPAPAMGFTGLQHNERGKLGRALDRVESALERFIAPGEPSAASGGWTSGAGKDRN